MKIFNNMRNSILSAMAMIAVGSAFVSCSSEEETPAPLFHNPIYFFMPADDATDPTSQLRRDFKEKYGSYLLFNDTIQKNYVGKDINGDDCYQYETLDVMYFVGNSSSNDQYKYTYITDYEQQVKAVEFMDQYILCHLSGDAVPFSWMLADVITGRLVSGSATKPYCVAGERTICASLNYILVRDRTDAQKKQLADRIINILVKKVAKDNIHRMKDFIEISSSHYSVSHEFSDTDRKDGLAKWGFIGVGSIQIFAPSTENDIEQYALATVTYTDESFEAEWGAYPLVMKKFKMMKEILLQSGFIF